VRDAYNALADLVTAIEARVEGMTDRKRDTVISPLMQTALEQAHLTLAATGWVLPESRAQKVSRELKALMDERLGK
jgi:hypothetical protein